MGYFGDSLLRKFDATPPPEWVEAIDDLNDFQIRRGFRRLRFGWKGGVPNLPDFVRLCRAIGDDAPDEGPRELVSLPAPTSTQQFDGWDISGNFRFLKYVTNRLTSNPRAWGGPPPGEPWFRNGNPTSGAQAESTRIAVRYKNAWAQDMREGYLVNPGTGEIVPPGLEEQAQTFAECMKRAEADIAAYLSGLEHAA